MNENVKKMDVSGVRKMFEMASQLKDPVDLSLGLPDFNVPKQLRKTAMQAIEDGENRYTPTAGLPELRKAIQKKLEQQNNITIDENQIIVTLAGSGALSIILTTIISPGDEIIIFDPYFVAYKQLIIQNGGIPIPIDTYDNFSINTEKLQAKINQNTKAIIVNSPNNPTGKVYSEDELTEIAEIAEAHGILIISDEVYEKFCYEKKHFSIGSIYENTITINAFSKTCAMTGWRVGYCAGPKEIIDQALKVQQYNFVCAPRPFQIAGITAAEFSIDHHVAAYREKRDIIYDGLKNKYSLHKPEGAFYAFVKFPEKPEKFVEKCLKNNLLIVPGETFSEKNTHFRISFANKRAQLQKAVKVLNSL